MINTLASVFNFFLGLWDAIPGPIRLFAEWTLAAFAVLWLFIFITGWLK